MAKGKHKKSKPDITELKCPHCGNTDLDAIVYLEDVQSQRCLNGIRNGMLIISDEANEFVEHAENPRLECHADNCWKEFPLPECETDYE
jgi:hypothetical protein